METRPMVNRGGAEALFGYFCSMEERIALKTGTPLIALKPVLLLSRNYPSLKFVLKHHLLRNIRKFTIIS